MEKKFIKLTPFKMQVLQSFPYIDADFDAITNYQLLCKVVEYLNITVDNVNLLSDDFKTLYDYVHDYFDNLDVQNEINNKLDEMALSGELEEIMADYLNTRAVFGFDNISSMKQATNLVDGSYAQTLGYYSKDDGGDALYKIRTITNNDIVDEMIIIALADESLIAELIVNDPYVNVRKFGIRETETGDISSKLATIITYLNNKNLIPYISLLNIDTTLTIPMSARIKIDRINYTGTDYAVSLSQGIYGNIDVEKVYSLTGAGVHINPEGTYSGNGYYKFNSVAVNGHSMYFDNDSSIVNSTFESVQLYSREDNALVIKPLTDSVVGQCNFKINNIYAVDHIGIVIDTSLGMLTNLDFGYCSVEGSTDGILINLENATEGIKGFFRVNEVASHADNSYVLKIKGEAQDIRNQFDFTFDSFPYSKIDLSELTMNTYASRSAPNILIQGKCFNPVGDVIGYSGRVLNNRLCMDYLNSPNPYNLTASVDLNYETSGSNPRISSYFTTTNLASDITVTLPKSLKPGAICALVNNSGHTVTFKPYGSNSGVNFATSAIFTTFINGTGGIEVVKLQ